MSNNEGLSNRVMDVLVADQGGIMNVRFRTVQRVIETLADMGVFIPAAEWHEPTCFQGNRCTRPEGHDGSHIAHGLDEEGREFPVLAWEDDRV